MPLPEWVKKYRKPKTEIRFLKNSYYVYSVSYKYSKELKRTKKITGVLLGKITQEEGFVRGNKDRLRDAPAGKIHIAEYGAYNLFLAHMKQEIKYLEESFANSTIDWKQVIAAAITRLMYQSTIKMMDSHWQDSFLQTEWKVSLNDKKVSELLRMLGDSRENIIQYFKRFPVSGEYLLIDTTSIPSKSEKIDIVSPGYNRQMKFSPQTNLFFIFSTQLQMPVYYRVVPGDIRDVKSFSLSLEESGIKNAIIIADKGFHSKSNIEMLDEARLQYILPMKRNNGLINYKPFSIGTMQEMTGVFKFEDRFVWYYQSNNTDGHGVITFLDEKLKVQEKQDYLQRILTHPEEYTMDGFYGKQFEFGTLSVITNLKDDPEKIYQAYKCRGQIEQVFDTYKNYLDADRTYMQNEKALYGWSFINFIAIQAYYKIFNHIKSNEFTKKHSVEDIINFSMKSRKLRINDKWTDSEITKKYQKIVAQALPIVV